MGFSQPPCAGYAVPEHEKATLEQLKRLAWLLDSSIRLPGGFRIGADALIGLIALVGDFFDAAWKANQRNVQLLRRHRENPAHTARSSRRVILVALVGLILFLAVASSLSALLLGWLLTVAMCELSKVNFR